MTPPTPNKRAQTIIRQFQVGMLQELEALRKLEAVHVRGAFDRHGTFRGYDYGRMQAIEAHFSGVVVEA